LAWEFSDATKLLFEKYKELIEVIIANDDTMAIGAVKALQEYGYNKGDKSKTIPIVGVDVTPEAKEFIEKGYMLGSVYQDPRAYAEALYACGMNLINFKSPIAGTKYTLYDTRVSIRIPHTNYLYKNKYYSPQYLGGFLTDFPIPQVALLNAKKLQNEILNNLLY